MYARFTRVLTRFSLLAFVSFPACFFSLAAHAETEAEVEVWVASDCGPCAPWKNKVKELTGQSGVGDHIINDGTKTYRIHWKSTYHTPASAGGSPTGSYPSIQFPGGSAWAAGPVKPLDPEELKRRAEAAKAKAEADAKLAAEQARAESERIRKLGRSEEGWTPTKSGNSTTTGIGGFTFPKGTVAFRHDKNKYLVKDADGKITGSDGKVYVDPKAEAEAARAAAEAKTAKVGIAGHGDQVAGSQGSRAVAPLGPVMDLPAAFEEFNNEADKSDAKALAQRKARLEALSEEVLTAIYAAEPTAEQAAIKAQVVEGSWVCEADGSCHFTLRSDGTETRVELLKKEGRVKIGSEQGEVPRFKLKGLFDSTK